MRDCFIAKIYLHLNLTCVELCSVRRHAYRAVPVFIVDEVDLVDEEETDGLEDRVVLLEASAHRVPFLPQEQSRLSMALQSEVSTQRVSKEAGAMRGNN